MAAFVPEVMMALLFACAACLGCMAWPVGIRCGVDKERGTVPRLEGWRRLAPLAPTVALFGLGALAGVIPIPLDRSLVVRPVDTGFAMMLGLPMVAVALFGVGVFKGQEDERKRREAGCGYCTSCQTPMMRSSDEMPHWSVSPSPTPVVAEPVFDEPVCHCYCEKCTAALGLVPDDYLDDVEAAKSCRRAAEQGHLLAQVKLGFLYEIGRGVTRDDSLAYFWLNIAASRSRVDDVLPAVAKVAAGAAAKKLTPEQLTKAQEMAREWKPKPEKP